MLAWAATAVSLEIFATDVELLSQVHAILDQAVGQNSKFGEKYEGPFRRHVVVLEALRSKKPVIYHKFAHMFYMEAS